MKRISILAVAVLALANLAQAQVTYVGPPAGYGASNAAYGVRGVYSTRPRTTVFYQPTIMPQQANSYVPGSEPAQGQLRAYPVVAAPPGVTGVPSDSAGVVVPRFEPDVTYVGPNRYMAGYRGNVRRPFVPSATGMGLPLVQFGGLADNFAPIDYDYPTYGLFSGYNGTLVPGAAQPMGGYEANYPVEQFTPTEEYAAPLGQ